MIEKHFSKICACRTGVNTQKGFGFQLEVLLTYMHLRVMYFTHTQLEVLLTYVHLRVMHSTHTVILKSPSGPSSSSTLNKGLCVWPLGRQRLSRASITVIFEVHQ